MPKAANLKSHFERWGLWGTLRFLLLRFASDVLGIHIFVARVRRTPDELENPCRVPGIVYRKVEPDELERFTGKRSLLLDKPFVDAARERGDILFGAFDGSRLAGYVWRTTTTAPHTDDVWVRAQLPYGYSYKSYARPEYRGQRIVPGLILYSDHAMLEVGQTHRVGIIALSNFASMAMAGPLGSYNLGHIGYVHWFGRPFFFRSKAVAEIGLELYKPEAGQ